MRSPELEDPSQPIPSESEWALQEILRTSGFARHHRPGETLATYIERLASDLQLPLHHSSPRFKTCGDGWAIGVVGAAMARAAGTNLPNHNAWLLAAYRAAENDVLQRNAQVQATLQAPPQQAGLLVAQEPKYTVDGTSVLNRASGSPIPADEPIFILRACDKLAVRVLLFYARFCTGAHFAAVRKRIADFKAFAVKHPQRMKAPDTLPEAQERLAR